VRRGSDEVLITQGYQRFADMIETMIGQLCSERGISDISPRALTSGLIGMFEGLLRDRTLQVRAGKQPDWSVNEIKKIFEFCIPRLFGEK
jgi:hypothetical protein